VVDEEGEKTDLDGMSLSHLRSDNEASSWWLTPTSSLLFLFRAVFGPMQIDDVGWLKLTYTDRTSSRVSACFEGSRTCLRASFCCKFYDFGGFVVF
jgi:hypothetical protein